MTDEELTAFLRDLPFLRAKQTADRIEQLINLNEALVELLDTARADAKEAEAYAEELAKDQVDLCSQLIAAEDKLEKAVEALTFYTCAENVCDNCPEQDRGRVSCGWTARETLAEIESSTPYGLEGEKG